MIACTRRALLWLALCASVALPALGCAASRAVPPRAPALSGPGDAVPPDLDLVVRVDLGRIRASLGPEGLALVRRGAATALAGDAMTELLQGALERSDTVLVALRPELVPGEADNVLVLEGRFRELDVDGALRAGGWSSPEDLGGFVRRFDHPGKLTRSSAARIYAFGTERLVFVSKAEIDSVEAVVEGRLAPTPLRPKASGVLAFAARIRGLKHGLGYRYPLLAEALGEAAHVEGSVDPTATGLALELSFELPSEAMAEESARALSRIKDAVATTDGKLGSAARGAEASAVGRFVVLRVALERGIL